jgi:hypothetical protein
MQRFGVTAEELGQEMPLLGGDQKGPGRRVATGEDDEAQVVYNKRRP